MRASGKNLGFVTQVVDLRGVVPETPHLIEVNLLSTV